MEKIAIYRIEYAKNINSSTSSKYGKNTQQNISNETNAIYIKGLENKKLVAGEQAYIYLTFKVDKKDVTENDNVYTNYAEINGYYQFPPKGEENSNGIVPGNYIVRFIYGGNKQTLSTILREDGTLEKLSYNGQDFKSTIYQKDMLTNSNLEKEYYDISALDNYGKNLSDARDLWEDKKVTIKQANQTQEQSITLQGRQTLINSSKTLTNAISEFLALPYTQNSISDEDVEKLRPYTEMVAETAIIKIEGEYDRTESSLTDNNGTYVLKNVDFGLAERPKAQLELNKKVEHIKLTLANGNVLFDTKQATNNLIWQGAKNYNLDTKMEKNKYNYT